MAERLDAWEWPTGRRGNPQWPWDEWLDGAPWRLSREQDFGSAKTAESLINMARNQALRRGGNLRSTRLSDNEVVIQFINKPPGRTGRNNAKLDHDLIISMWRAGHSAPAIAEQCGSTTESIRSVLTRLRNAGADVPYRYPPRNPKQVIARLAREHRSGEEPELD